MKSKKKYTLKTCGNRHGYCHQCRPDIVEKMSAAQTGRKRTPEARAKLSATQRGVAVSAALIEQMKGADTPKRRKRQKVLKGHGLTLAEYDELVRKAGGVCEICKLPETKRQHGQIQALTVDHDHATNRVRGILCWGCNYRLGLLEGSWFNLAQQYLALRTIKEGVMV